MCTTHTHTHTQMHTFVKGVADATDTFKYAAAAPVARKTTLDDPSLNNLPATPQAITFLRQSQESMPMQYLAVPSPLLPNHTHTHTPDASQRHSKKSFPRLSEGDVLEHMFPILINCCQKVLPYLCPR